MKAVAANRFGPPDVLRLVELEPPSPAENEVLIKVHATTVNAGDYRVRGMDVPFEFWLPARLGFGLLRPKYRIPGSELAGEIVATGARVQRFRVGDQVFGIDGQHLGACAGYVCKPEHAALALKPASMSYEQAAAVPFGALTALYFLRDRGNIRNGQKVMIYGASGGVGTAAVQLARYFGAQVTAVCSSANVAMVKSLGAGEVIDYTREDFTRRDDHYDIIFDTVGKAPFSSCKAALKPSGLHLATVFRLNHLVQMAWTSVTGGRKTICAVAPERTQDLEFLRELIEAGELTAVIDRTWPLEQIVEAHRYAEQGHKKGNVVITVGHDESD